MKKKPWCAPIICHQKISASNTSPTKPVTGGTLSSYIQNIYHQGSQGKNIDLNNFKSDVLSDVIKEYQLEFEYSRDVKGEMINPT